MDESGDGEERKTRKRREEKQERQIHCLVNKGCTPLLFTTNSVSLYCTS